MDARRTLAYSSLVFLLALAWIPFAAAENHPATPTPVPGAPCTQQFVLASVDFDDPQTVSAGGTATFTFVVTNGDYTQPLDVSAQCDPDVFSCRFIDVPYPNFFAARETKIFHLQAYTTTATPAGNYSIPVQVTAYAPHLCAENGVLSLRVNPPAAVPTPVPVSATLSPTGTQNALPGETVSYAISLENNLDERTFAVISQDGNPFAASTLLSALQVSLEPKQSKTVTANAFIPAGTPGGAYAWSFNVRGGGERHHDVFLPASIFVLAPTVNLAFENALVAQQCTPVAAGQAAVLELGVRNNGESRGPYRFSVEADAETAALVSLSTDLLEIVPGDRQTLAIRLAPSRFATLDTYHYVLVVHQGDFVVSRQNYCFTVNQGEGVRVNKPDFLIVPRGERASTFIEVVNVGGTRETIAVSHAPQPALGLSASPLQFTLNPDGTQTLEIAFNPPMASALRDYSVPLTLQTTPGGRTVAVNLAVKLYSSNRSDAAFLQFVDAPSELVAVRGKETRYEITVRNAKNVPVNDVALGIAGVPAEWYSVTPPQDLGVNQERAFFLTLHPGTASDATFRTQLYAHAPDREGVAQDAVVRVVAQDFRLNFEAFDARVVDAGTFAFSVEVRNDGTEPLRRVSPVLFASEQGLVLESSPGTVDIAPGETAVIQVVVRAAPGASTGEQDATLRLGSEEGVAVQQTIRVPALKSPSAGLPGYAWKLVAILLLLVGIFALLTREEPPKRIVFHD